jgi:hypothetical protein
MLYLALSYIRPEPAPLLPGVSYVVEVSGDMETWTTTETEVIATADNHDGTRTITVRDTRPMAAATVAFYPAQGHQHPVRGCWNATNAPLCPSIAYDHRP